MEFGGKNCFGSKGISWRVLSLIKKVWKVVFGGGNKVWDVEVEVRRVECVSGCCSQVGGEDESTRVKGWV